MSPERPSLPAAVEIFDTTLRDGSQLEGISLTVEDKLRVAEQLDLLGVHYIEGGWPGANPKDTEFFARAPQELNLETATLVAFGSTRRAGGDAATDPVLANLVAANTSTVCIVAKSWDYHVLEALRTTLDEAVAMVADSVRFLVDAGLTVFVDAEHFFDGYKRNPDFALRVLDAAADAGASCLVLCDTNGGCLPHEIEPVVADVVARFSPLAVGIHTQNDTGCAVPNAIAAVLAGATQVQVTMNGYGERTGNCDLTQLVPDLTLKMGIATLPEGRLEHLTEVSHHIAELVNMPLSSHAPYVGPSAFAHKAGLHTSAIARGGTDAYEHVDPTLVGNHTRMPVSEYAGRASVLSKAKEIGIDIGDDVVAAVLEELKELENRGYHFEVADGSLELLMRRAAGWEHHYFEIESFKASVEHRDDGTYVSEATVKLVVDGERLISTAEGNGPVNALDAAVRGAIGRRYPQLGSLHLVDYKVRVLDTGSAGTGAVTRVLIDSTDGERTWTTIGVSENIIEASWQALSDSLVFGLLHSGDR